MSSATAELDLTIHARPLPAPSQAAATSLDRRASRSDAQEKYPLTFAANCGSDVWDCTAAWVCD